MSEYVNMGDYSYWRDTKTIKDFDGSDIPVDRDMFVNGAALRNVIFPANPVKDYEGDIVPIGDYAGRQFAYAWWRESKSSDDRMTYGNLKAKGYDFATTDKFKVVREAFYIDGEKIYFGDTVLMACPAERWEAERKKAAEFEARRTGQSLERVSADFSETVARAARDTGVSMVPIVGPKSSAGKRK